MYELVDRNIDTLTGEIITERKKVFRRVNVDDFMQVYLRDMSGLMGIKNMAEYQILIWFWKFSKFPDDNIKANYVSLDAILFQRIKESTGLKEQSIRNSICSLAKKNILIKDDKMRGIYYLNPNYFWKGKISENTKNIKVMFDYDFTNENNGENKD